MRRHSQGFTLIEIMVVIAIIAGLIGTVAILVPQMQERQRKTTCQMRLSQLGGLFVTEQTEKPGKPKYDGSALWLSWRANTSRIRKDEESTLICPGDQGVRTPETPDEKARYDNVDLRNPPNDLTSFAARDFSAYPLNVESPEAQIIGCDRNGPDGRTQHHKNGLNCVFDNASTRFIEREELAISPGDPIIVGPEANNEMLKKVVGAKSKKD